MLGGHLYHRGQKSRPGERAKIAHLLGSVLAQHSASQKAPHSERGVLEGMTGMRTPGEGVVSREPPVKVGKSGLKALLQPLREMLLSAKQF